MGLTLLSHVKMPLKFWVEAYQTAVFTINLLPATPLHFQSPFEKLYRKFPNYLQLQPFGCTCFPYLRPYSKHKFNFYSTKCVLLGYSHVHAGYKCMDSSSQVYVTHHVIFNPDEFPYPQLFPVSVSSRPLSQQSSSSSLSTDVLNFNRPSVPSC